MNLVRLMRRIADSAAFRLYMPDLRVAVMSLLLTSIFVIIPRDVDVITRLAEAVWVLGLAIVIVIWPKARILAFVPIAGIFLDPPFPTSSVVSACAVLLVGPLVLRRVARRSAAIFHRSYPPESVDSDTKPRPSPCPLTATVDEALRRAAEDHGLRGSVSTGAVLVALSEADRSGDWERFWMVCGYPSPDRLRAAADPVTTSVVDLRRLTSIDLTQAAHSAVMLADDLCRNYGLQELSAGLLAIGLLADPASGAMTTLLDTSGLTSAQMRDAAQSDLLGVELIGLEDTVHAFSAAGAGGRDAAVTQVVRGRQADPVRIVAADRDRDAKATLENWLDAEDIVLVVADGAMPMAHRTVVVVSRAATVDAAWIAAVEALPSDTAVVVRIDDVRATELPETIRKITWIDWRPTHAMDSRLILLRTLRSSRNDYRWFTTLTAEAAEWARRGRRPELLIRSAERAKAASRYLQEAAGPGVAAPSELITRYVHASLRATGVELRRVLRRWLYRLTVLALLAVFVTVVVIEYRGRGRLELTNLEGMGAVTSIDSRPDRVAMLQAPR